MLCNSFTSFWLSTSFSESKRTKPPPPSVDYPKISRTDMRISGHIDGSLAEEVIFVKSSYSISVSVPSSYSIGFALRIDGSIVNVATLHGFMNTISKSKLTFVGTFIGPNALTVAV